MRKLAFLVVFLFGVHICFHASFAHSDFRAEVVFKNTSVIWAFTWLPNGDMLISERGGKVLRVRDGNVIAEIKGIPTERAKGQGGLLDQALHPAYESNQLVYMSYSDPSTAVVAIQQLRVHVLMAILLRTWKSSIKRNRILLAAIILVAVSHLIRRGTCSFT